LERVALRSTRCAICGTEGNATTLYESTLDERAFTAEVFSARRRPDRIHYRLVKCNSCGLVRSDPATDPSLLARLYGESEFPTDELQAARRTYGRHLDRALGLGAQRGSLLEIGSGTGFFLEEALARGFREVRGVEPSRSAVASASPAVRGRIVCDVMRPGLFAPESFDVVCIFHVMDHLSDPGAVLDECRNVLRPGGLLLCLNHDVEALSARLLGERSPIVDVEHTYLYSRRTMARLIERHGFAVLESKPAWTTFSLRYLVHLAPLPGKSALLRLLSGRLGSLRLTIPFVNLYAIARKPG
jgi:SAM-dependent methyltransferase